MDRSSEIGNHVGSEVQVEMMVQVLNDSVCAQALHRQENMLPARLIIPASLLVICECWLWSFALAAASC